MPGYSGVNAKNNSLVLFNLCRFQSSKMRIIGSLNVILFWLYFISCPCGGKFCKDVYSV